MKSKSQKKLLVDGFNLLEQPSEYYENLQRESSIALRSRSLLSQVAKTISEAGGEIPEEDLAKMPLSQFIVIATRNGITIDIGVRKTSHGVSLGGPQWATNTDDPLNHDVPF
jgi:hypothetical protein